MCRRVFSGVYELPIIKVQCKHTLNRIGGPDLQKLLGVIQDKDSALFVTVGDYATPARHIDRNNSRLRLIGGSELVALIFSHYEKLDPRFKALLPVKPSYTQA